MEAPLYRPTPRRHHNSNNNNNNVSIEGMSIERTVLLIYNIVTRPSSVKPAQLSNGLIDMDPENVPANLKVEGPDWFAL